MHRQYVLWLTQQHPLRRNATFMRKKANHLLGFLSEKSEIKDMLSHWHSPAPEVRAEEPKAAAAPAPAPRPPPPPDVHVDEEERDEALGTPFAQHVALRRSVESTLVFSDLDPRLDVAAAEGQAEASTSDSSGLPAALSMLEQVQLSGGVDPLGTALSLRRRRRADKAPIPPHDATHAWWAACGSDAMLCAGVPAVPHAGRARGCGDPMPSPPSRLPSERAGMPRMMARNIKTMRRLHHTHQKFFKLADVVEHELPIPADLAYASSSDEEGDDDAPEAPRPPHTPFPTLFPRLTPQYAREQMSWQVQMLLAHTGFDGSHTAALQVLTDVTREYMMSLGRTLRLYADRFAPKMDAEEMVVHALHGSGGTRVCQLDAYVKNDVERYGVRLREWLRKLQGAYREQLTNLGRAVVEDDELLADDGQALALGHFAEGLGDDFFGFREMGLDRELGLAGLSVPSRLFYGRGGGQSVVASDGDRKTAPTYAPPPPVVPVCRASLPAQIGLLRPWYAAHLAGSTPAQPTDIVPETSPERPRYKVPTSGKLPVRPLYGETPAEARAPDKKGPAKPPPAKRKRAAPA